MNSGFPCCELEPQLDALPRLDALRRLDALPQPALVRSSGGGRWRVSRDSAREKDWLVSSCLGRPCSAARARASGCTELCAERDAPSGVPSDCARGCWLCDCAVASTWGGTILSARRPLRDISVESVSVESVFSVVSVPARCWLCKGAGLWYRVHGTGAACRCAHACAAATGELLLLLLLLVGEWIYCDSYCDSQARKAL